MIFFQFPLESYMSIFSYILSLCVVMAWFIKQLFLVSKYCLLVILLLWKRVFFLNAYKTNEKSMIFTFRGSKLGAKTYQKPWFCMEIVPKRFQDAPRRSQDAPKMRQDAPRRPKDGPRPPRGRARTAPRRRQTPQDGSKMVPRGARDGPRRPQIRKKKRPKSDPKHNPLQT